MQYKEYLKADDIFQGYYQLNNLEPEQDNLVLTSSRMIADEDGRSSVKKAEGLSCFNQAKKELVLTDTPPEKALLIFFIHESKDNDKPLIIYINDNKFEFSPGDIKGHFLWRTLAIQGQVLHRGVNNIIFTGSEVEPNWSIALEINNKDVKRSFKSIDGGQSWQTDYMAYDSSLQGEYLVRLVLEFAKKSGSIISPVYRDLQTKGKITDFFIEPGFINNNEHNNSEKRIDFKTQIRTANYKQGLPVWTDWINIDYDGIELDNVDALQWRGLLESESRISLQGITYVIGFSEQVEDYVQTEKVIKHPFAGKVHNDKLNYIIENEGLREMLAPLESEFEKFVVLREWVSRQWKHHLGEPYPGWDPVIILDWLQNKKPEACGFCVIHNQLYYQLCLALGLIARPIIITRNINMYKGGHFVTEVYSHDYDSWVIMDANYNIHYELDNKPLNALKLHQIALQGEEDKVILKGDPNYHPNGYEGAKDLERYLYFGVIPLEKVYDSIYKGPVEHGQGAYRWNGFLWWFDKNSRKQPQFSAYTNRKQILYQKPMLINSVTGGHIND